MTAAKENSSTIVQRCEAEVDRMLLRGTGVGLQSVEVHSRQPEHIVVPTWRTSAECYTDEQISVGISPPAPASLLPQAPSSLGWRGRVAS